MLLVKTIVKNSSIEGVGLFAEEFIKKGRVIWRYTPATCSILTKQQLDLLVNSFHKENQDVIRYYLTYGFFVSKLKGLVVCLDNARYVNHSESPNICTKSGIFKKCQSIAIRNIEKGEEITDSYNSYDAPFWCEQMRERLDEPLVCDSLVI